MFSLAGIAAWFTSSAAAAIFKTFGDSIIQPLLNVYLKAKDVDLEKFKASDASTEHLAVAVLDANNKFAETKSQYALSILQWWPFRLILFWLIAVATIRFTLASFDSTWWWIDGCMIDGKAITASMQKAHDVCSWSFPAIKGTFGEAEKEFLFAFIIAKPIDSAVTGLLALLSRYLKR